MKNKKGIIIVVILLLLGGVIFYFKDSRNMDDVAAEQEQSIDDATEQTLNEDNVNFSDDVDFGEIEEAPLALDTTKEEK